uniref:Uncharacterized protein n=2 Tax=Nonomuraea gerenzanensis TaxID=93944 RepID=A0A1M4ERC3_9ACTN|nr:hypothetical protein BN4615_P10915 [Nonomuraea gerenzanensis]
MLVGSSTRSSIGFTPWELVVAILVISTTSWAATLSGMGLIGRLQWLMAALDRLPWRSRRFLKTMVACGLMLRDGRTYRYPHLIFQQHFTAMAEKERRLP